MYIVKANYIYRIYNISQLYKLLRKVTAHQRVF